MASHSKKPSFIDPVHCHIGKPVSATKTGIPALGAFNHMRNWAGNYHTFAFSGPPKETYNPAGDNTTFSFYVIHHAPEQYDDEDRRLEVDFAAWPKAAVEQTLTIEYYPLWSSASNGLTLHEEKVAVTRTLTYDQRLAGEPFYRFRTGTDGSGDEVDITYTPSATGAFTASAIDITNYMPAALSVYPIPQRTPSDDQSVVVLNDVQPGSVVRGYTGTGQASLGDIIHLTGDRRWDNDSSQQSTEDSCDAAIRRCLFQTGHHSAYYQSGTSFANMFGLFTPKFYMRNLLKGTDTDVVLPAFIAKGYGDVKYTITNDTGSSTATCAVDTASYALFEPSDFSSTLSAEVDGINTLKIEVKADSSNELVIKTVSLWEAGPNF